MLSKKILAVAALLLCTSPALAQAPAPAARPAAAPVRPTATPPLAPTFADVLVAHTEYQGKPLDLKMNVWLPPGPKGAPTAVMLAGGGIAMNLLDHGIAVASYHYQTNGMPGMIYDLKAYVRFLRAHAAEYNIDPKRIGFMGGSRAGGLAAMMAVTGDNKEMEGNIGGNLEQSSMLQAIVIDFALTDIMRDNVDAKVVEMIPLYLEDVDIPTSRKIVAAFRKHDTKSPYWKYVVRMEKFNPLNYITKDSPPALLAGAGDDMGNPLINSIAMYEKYLEQGAPAHLYTYTLGTHGNVGKNIEEATAQWLVEHLAKSPPPQFAAPLRKQPSPSTCATSGFCTPDPIIANRTP